MAMAVWKASSAGAGLAGSRLQQDFAAQTMEVRSRYNRSSISSASRQSSSIERQSARPDLTGLGLELGEQTRKNEAARILYP